MKKNDLWVRFHPTAEDRGLFRSHRKIMLTSPPIGARAMPYICDGKNSNPRNLTKQELEDLLVEAVEKIDNLEADCEYFREKCRRNFQSMKM